MSAEVDSITPFTNKGLSFTKSERERLGLVGKMPSIELSFKQQVTMEYLKIKRQPNDFFRNYYLSNLFHSNRPVYFALIQEYVEELLPIIYTPTIADSVMSFSNIYLGHGEALYLDSDFPEKIEESIKNVTKNASEIDIMVITDGEGVLGIGDWGINGVEITFGKSSVYSVAAGIDPKRILPVIIDNGTNNEELLNSPVYIGKRKRRKTGEPYLQFIDMFVEISNNLFPNVLFHWEDFGRNNAQKVLDRYINRVVSFNDDIQGTGITVVSAVNKGLEIKKESYSEQKFVIFGAGTAGVGVAEQIKNDMIVQGLSEIEAINRIYLVDKEGIVTIENAVTDGQLSFARNRSMRYSKLKNLIEIVREIKPSFLIGCSGQKNTFGKEVIQLMTNYQKQPAIFPLSNPSKLSESNACDIIRWSEGKALVVTGSPSDPITFNGNVYKIGQANNALFYPGLGLGIISSKAVRVTDKMLSAAARAFILDGIEYSKNNDLLLPEIKNLRECSLAVARAVFIAAVEEGVASSKLSEIDERIRKYSWNPSHEDVIL